jgi:3-hydroxyisobutyrate dehydrogenase
MAEQIAFLGLGVMGAPMAANLAKKGYSVKGWNRSGATSGVTIASERGVNVVSSLKEAVTKAEIIFSCVSDVPDVEEVLLGSQGVVQYASSGVLVVDMSTIGSDAAKRIGHQLNQRQLRFLDAPISGGDIGAINGTLTIMVGGELQDFEECKPLLAAMGKNIRLCGSVGSGQAVKMCNQVLASIYMVALCEAIKLAEQQGIDRNLIIEVCSTGAAGSWALSNLAPKIVESDYAPGFMIKHILKDLRLVQEITQASGENLPGVELSDRLFKIVQQLDQGKGGEQGTQAMFRAYNQLSVISYQLSVIRKKGEGRREKT